MGLPVPRIELMLHRALRAIPLPADKDPVTVLCPIPCPCTSMLHGASKAVYRDLPLFKGPKGVARGVQVIYEDDDLLAVSKPPFLPTAPRHRWEVCRWCVLGQTLQIVDRSSMLASFWRHYLTYAVQNAGRQLGQPSSQLSW